MKKMLPSLFAFLSALLLTIALAGPITRPIRLDGFSETAAAKIGNWLYGTLPALPELFLPLVFAATVLSIAILIAHHLREDARLNELRDLSTRENRRTIRSARHVQLRRASASNARLIPQRAAW